MNGSWQELDERQIQPGQLIAYGEGDPPSSGYIARLQPDLTVNGLTLEFIRDQYDWVFLIDLDI